MKRFLTLAAMAAAFAPLTGSGVAAQGDGVTVTVTVTEMRNSKGVVRACMTTQEKHFPKCRKDPASYRTVLNANGAMTFTFKNVQPGKYAIALLHDENDNGKADRALMMMPKEGFGFSRDAKVRMGPPSFKDAVFDVTAQDIRHSIRMRYLL